MVIGKFNIVLEININSFSLAGGRERTEKLKKLSELYQ